jgi:hypothetical protein
MYCKVLGGVVTPLRSGVTPHVSFNATNNMLLIKLVEDATNTPVLEKFMLAFPYQN